MSTHITSPPPIPIVIVAGFLGSGKTTLMRRLIASARERGLRCAVIVNEFGEIDVDANILRQSFSGESSGDGSTRGTSSSAFDDDFIAGLAGGCACCSGRDELHETLLELASRAPTNQAALNQHPASGESVAAFVAGSGAAANETFDAAISDLPDANASPMRPDVILMEASGLADPVTLLEVVSAPDLLALVRVEVLIGVVDAARYGNLPSALTPLLRRQLQLADFLVVNKADLVEIFHLEEVETQIRSFNASASMERTFHATMQTDVWDFVCGSDLTPTPQQQGQENAFHTMSIAEATSGKATSGEATSGKAKHAQSHTLICSLPHPVERARLEAALTKLPDEVWRVKGFVRLRGENGWFLLQYTGGAGGGRSQMAPFFLLAGVVEPTAALVFIGSALDHEKLRHDFGSGALGALW